MIEQPFPTMALGIAQSVVIVMFDIVGTNINLPIFQPLIQQNSRSMQAFAKDGIIILQQVLNQSLGAARIDDKRRET